MTSALRRFAAFILACTLPGFAGGLSTDAPAPLVLPELPSYVKDIESIRHLTFKRPVANARESEDEFRAFVAKELDDGLPAARAETEARALAKLGLLPERFDLRKAVADMLTSQVAAYYDPLRQTFFVVRSDLPAALIRPTVIHELTHALQDQRFDLARRVKELRGIVNDDVQNAFRFLAEGEASYVMLLSTLRAQGMRSESARQAVDAAVDLNAGMGRDDLRAQLDAAQKILGPEAEGDLDAAFSYPDYLFRTLFDPYFAGQRAIHRVYRAGGWDAVTALWRNPPASTELLLHPEKLVSGKRDAPVTVAVPDLSAALGPGYAPSCENTLGEFGAEILLEQILAGSSGPGPRGIRAAGRASDAHQASIDGSEGSTEASAGMSAPAGPQGTSDADRPAVTDEDTASSRARTLRARSAAAGWGGDRYRAFEKQGGGTIVVWRTVWDTEADAAEFEQAIGEGTVAESALTAVRRGKAVTVVAGGTAEQARALFGALYPDLRPRAHS